MRTGRGDPLRFEMNRLAKINDHFRKAVLTEPRDDGKCVVTAGIHALAPDTQMIILARVGAFNTFTIDNDPYGEHEFGAFEMMGVGKVFWRIDYYEDDSMEWGAEEPATKAYRVLTIMLADEY